MTPPPLFSTQAPCKVILVGEHGVVYGTTALAVALPQITVALCAYESPLHSWDEAWVLEGYPLTPTHRARLSEALAYAWKLASSDPLPAPSHRLVWKSAVAWGSGMGTSAAISLCLLRYVFYLAEQNFEALPPAQQAFLTNQLDSLFHGGRASGLDATTIVYGGVVSFQKDRPPQAVANKKGFYLALLYSHTPKDTATMTGKVAACYKQHPQAVDKIFQEMEVVSQQCQQALLTGELERVGQSFQQAQGLLQQLGVSHPSLEAALDVLRQQGAWGAKLTGSGGGGFVLGLFAKPPSLGGEAIVTYVKGEDG